MKIACIIPAAGRGLRLGSEIPKQFLMLHDKMIIEYAIRSLIDGLMHCGIHHISLIISCDSERIADLESICSHYLPPSTFACVPGGKERKDSIANAMQIALAKDSDKVIIHDAARPFIPREVIDRLIEASKQYSCVIPILPVSDTLKKIEGEHILETCDRMHYALAQTPQIIDTKAYFLALQEIENKVFTDDASIMEYAGYEVHCIRGHEMMRKITFPYDMAIAELHAFMYEQLSGA
jgi:2-C-methyl-D-erythritol 4-phosphate cytidylyltransferase